jgi:LacI family transcriptional regulator
MRRVPRLKDVARHAGVSTATASRVINNTSHVSETNRRKVLRAIRRFNYLPNAHARTLASGRSNLIGLLISDITNPFFPELVKSIEAAAFEHGFEVLLSNTNYDPERLAGYARRFIEREVAGVALMATEFDAKVVSEFAYRSVSLVFLDVGTVGARTSNIVVDYDRGIGEAVEHLVSLGHRDVAYVGGPVRLLSAAKRLEAFRRAMARCLGAGPPLALYEADFRLEGGRKAAREMLGAQSLPTAVVVANDMMALGVMQECQAAGLHIPRDISVVGFDDIAFARLSDPPLTTVSLAREELGRRVVEALLSGLSGPAGVEISVLTRLVERGSTAPPAHAGRL